MMDTILFVLSLCLLQHFAIGQRSSDSELSTNDDYSSSRFELYNNNHSGSFYYDYSENVAPSTFENIPSGSMDSIFGDQPAPVHAEGVGVVTGNSPLMQYRVKRGRGGSRSRSGSSSSNKSGGGTGNTSGGKEHTKNARPSTQGKHEKGQSRKGADSKGGEKGDARRSYGK